MEMVNNEWRAAYERCDENIKSLRDRGFGELVDIVSATTLGHPTYITLIDSLASGTDEQLSELMQLLKRQEAKAMFDYEHSTIRQTYHGSPSPTNYEECFMPTTYIESGEIRHVYFDGVFAYAYNFVNPVWE